ncbi:MAG: phospho-N-acetylmuramoyl-pentapeptide transferase [Candidatus Berkelbacteria bacterium Licking1014_96]|uniref:Phospho-N-acetylmuramoyl-pentapeptide-transferase n=1 Tax=Candidatus Berkelbacteria bacterium Licking1014_96 TaxID=2017149 RepID=A0A554LFW2_9BACT|nr:MAG: phospho-N-acetylmuramoyl-pentapeptide transferase [Candidatus Berkelbacteria bacterium Licking1014_96]
MENIQISTDQLITLFIYVFFAFILTMLLTPILTHFLYKYRAWKEIKQDAITGEKLKYFNKMHAKKRHTPTMAGILIWVVVAVITLLFNFSRSQTYLPLFTLITVAVLGLIDDYINIRGVGGIRGINWKKKMVWLLIFAGVGAWWFYSKLEWNSIHIPGFGPYVIGWWYIPLFIFIFISSANAVNITDGLDGLAGGLLAIAFAAFSIIAMVQGNLGLAIFCGTIVGAVLAYTWFNIYPARFFMGDTGSLALGATLGVVAMLSNSVVALIIIGLVFFIELGSSALQIFSKKVFKKKIFLSAPLHHHFEALGWPETKVTMRFWVIGAVAAVIGLAIALIGRG